MFSAVTPHVAVVERVGERAHRCVDDRVVVHALAPAESRDPVLAPAHALGAPGHHDVRVAQLHDLRGRDDSLQARATEPIQRERRGLDREARFDRGHPGQVHVVDICVDDVAEHDVPDLARLDRRPLDRLAHDRGRQIRGRVILQAPAVPADRRSHAAQNHHLALTARHLVIPPRASAI
jgi:hypothetical protein